MKLNITSEKDNKLFNRKELSFEIEQEGSATPSRKEILDLLKVKISGEFIVIRKIESIFGSDKSKVVAHIYKNEADMKKNEPAHLVKRDTKAPKEKKAAEPAPAPAEAPAEEAKPEGEEKPVEEQPAEAEEEKKEETE